jgi:hypothetical protein
MGQTRKSVSDTVEVLFGIWVSSMFAVMLIGLCFAFYWFQTGLTLGGGWVRVAEFISLLVVVSGGVLTVVWTRKNR